MTPPRIFRRDDHVKQSNLGPGQQPTLMAPHEIFRYGIVRVATNKRAQVTWFETDGKLMFTSWVEQKYLQEDKQP